MTNTRGNYPALPFAVPEGVFYYPGMTHRDWLAGMALAQVIATCAGDTREEGEDMENMFARKAYRIADAMLAEGAK